MAGAAGAEVFFAAYAVCSAPPTKRSARTAMVLRIFMDPPQYA
jgi:hypothetical protein